MLMHFFKQHFFRTIVFCASLVLITTLVLFAGVNAQTATSTSQCTGLNLTLNDGKTTYSGSDFVNYTYSCTPSGYAANVTVQVVKPDGTATTYNFASNINASTMGFGVSNLTPGNYTLRVCFDSNCSPVTASAPFTVAAPAIASGNACTTSGSYGCATDGNSQLYCSPSTNQWQFSQFCATSNRTCNASRGTCESICGDNICGIYETRADCPYNNDCPAAATCTKLKVLLADNKTTYTKGDNISYTFSCETPSGAPATNGIVKLVKPDGTISPLLSITGATATSHSYGFPTTDFVAGSYTLKVCWDESCPAASTALISFSLVAPASTTPTSEQTKCTSGGGKWCLNADSTSGWCSNSSSPCPAYDATSCAAQSGEWCLYAGGVNGWCATMGATCPINDKTTCLAKNRNWCLPQGGSSGTGWCTATTAEKCPAYTEADCKSQSGEWCATTGGGTGWCSTPPIATYAGSTGSYGCPINDKTTCLAKSRSWCLPQGGGTGWCTMINEKCPAYDEASCRAQGSEWCLPQSGGTGWCSTGVGGCPIYEKSTCTAKGRTWCTPNYGGMGWCTMMATDTCGSGATASTPPIATPLPTPPLVVPTSTPAIPPPTVATMCPDGTRVLAGNACPFFGQEEYTTCPDGTRVHGSCYYTCPDGTNVLHSMTCPESAGVKVCAQKGGIWCFGQEQEKGYCSLTRKCFAVLPQPLPTTPRPPEGLDKQSITKAEQLRSSVVRQLKNLVTNFKRFNDDESFQKALVLIDKAHTAQMDAGIFDYLQVIREEANILDEIYADLKIQNQIPEQYERDKQLEQRALAQIKKNIRSFEGRLTVIKKRTDVLQKQGVNIPTELKEALTRGPELIKNIKNATNYDEAQDAVQALQDISQIINDYLPQLEQLSRLPRIFTLVSNELKTQDATLKRLRASAKRLRVDIESLLVEFEDKITGIRSALTSAKAGDFGDQEPFDYLQNNVVDQLNTLQDDSGTIQAITNLKQTVNTMSAKLTRYETKIKSLEKKKQNMTEARAILTEANAQLKALKGLSAAKITDDDVYVIRDGLQMLYIASGQLDNLLQMAQPSVLERELLRKPSGEELLKSIPLPELEKVSLNATRLATFYKRPPSVLAGYSTVKFSFAELSRQARLALGQ